MIPCHLCPVPATHIGTRDVVPLCVEHLPTVGAFHSSLTRADRMLWDHTLEVIKEDADVQVYRLTPPGGGEMESTRIAFLPGYIVLHGDVSPGVRARDHRGLISDVRYDRRWFVGATSESYLCQKFGLVKEFRADLAKAACEEMANETEDEVRAAVLRAHAVDAEDCDDPDAWERELYEITGDSECLDGCRGYARDNADLLCAIQRRFRGLWLQRDAGAGARDAGPEAKAASLGAA